MRLHHSTGSSNIDFNIAAGEITLNHATLISPDTFRGECDGQISQQAVHLNAVNFTDMCGTSLGASRNQ